MELTRSVVSATGERGGSCVTLAAPKEVEEEEEAVQVVWAISLTFCSSFSFLRCVQQLAAFVA